LNFVFSGFGQLYIGATRRAVPILIADGAGAILTTEGQSHKASALVVVGTLVRLASFLVSVSNAQLVYDAVNWRPHGRLTKSFAIVFTTGGAVIFVVLYFIHRAHS
jgi:hypothetical protein